MADNTTVSALYVERDGTYYGLSGVDPWDEERDARLYDGPHPVIAHPPCQRWGKMWAGHPSWIKRTGQRKILGDDNGCFAAALASVRAHGGVIERPWMSRAWPHFGLVVPPRSGGWVIADDCGGMTCCVEQGRYGHYAPKPTLLYVVGADLPDLEWGVYAVRDEDFPEWAMKKHGRAWCRRAGLLSFSGGGTDSSARIGTPLGFRDVLIDIARSAIK